jgi:hypothetical protein
VSSCSAAPSPRPRLSLATTANNTLRGGDMRAYSSALLELVSLSLFLGAVAIWAAILGG